MKRFILTLMLISFASTFVVGCNTVRGAGKDVEKAGQEVQEATH
jgi:predicted small secreted protein